MPSDPYPHVTFRTTHEFIERLRAAAKSDERTMSSALRLAASRYITERERAAKL